MTAKDFIKESNRIEGIKREPALREMDEFHRFMDLPELTVGDIEEFVEVYQPGTVLRDKLGTNVIVGGHMPPLGGPKVRKSLENILSESFNAYVTHLAYERLHPFTDCNGRSGRMIWAWMMRDIRLGFLHRFYYQALEHSR